MQRQATGEGAVSLADRVVDDVSDLVPATGPGGEPAYLAAGADVGAAVARGRQVGVVEGVLGAEVAADVAFAGQSARLPWQAVDVAVLRLGERGSGDRRPAGGRGERDGERRPGQVQAQPVRCLPHRGGLRRVLVGVRCGAEHLLDPVVVRIEVTAADRPVLVPPAGQWRFVDKPLLVLAQQDVGVDQRPASEAAGDDSLQSAERPDVEQSVQTLAGVPEVAGHACGRPGEVAGRVRFAALQNHDGQTTVGELVCGDRAAEARADHDDVDFAVDSGVGLWSDFGWGWGFDSCAAAPFVRHQRSPDM
jgi:hypothetical protein